LNRTVLALNFDLCQLLTRNRKFVRPNERQRISRATVGHERLGSSLQGLIESWVTAMDKRSAFSQDGPGKSFHEQSDPLGLSRGGVSVN
jgi:hypothetical protein